MKKPANIFVRSVLPTTIISIALQSPAAAELINKKLSDINQSQLRAYCSSKMRFTSSRITAKLADTHVECIAKISASASTEAEAQSRASLSAQRAGLRGSITASAQYGSSWKATFTSEQNSYHLNNWCRKKHSPNFYLPNPATGEGRIFVGDGGHACYKTVKR
jgi:hypothetical protein